MRWPYDLSASCFEGSHCPLAKIGYSRDGKRNKPQVTRAMLTDRRGCPVAVSVYPDDPKLIKTVYGAGYLFSSNVDWL